METRKNNNNNVHVTNKVFLFPFFFISFLWYLNSILFLTFAKNSYSELRTAPSEEGKYVKKLASSKNFHHRCFLTYLNVENEWK